MFPDNLKIIFKYSYTYDQMQFFAFKLHLIYFYKLRCTVFNRVRGIRAFILDKQGDKRPNFKENMGINTIFWEQVV